MQTASIDNGFDFHGAEAFFSEGFFDRGLEHGKAADKKRIGQADFQEQHFFGSDREDLHPDRCRRGSRL